MKPIDRFCSSRLARDNRGCQILCRLLEKGWLFGVRTLASGADLYTAEYLDCQRFRNN